MQQNVEPRDIQGECHRAIEFYARSQGKHAAKNVAMRNDAIDLRRDEKTGMLDGCRPPRLVGDVCLFGEQWHRGTEHAGPRIDTHDIGEIIESFDGVGEQLAAIRRGGPHLRLIGQGAQHLFAGRQHVLRVGCAAACGLNEAVADVADIALDTIDALNHADDRGGHQPDDDPEQKTQAQGSTTHFRWRLFLRLMLRRTPVRQGEPSGQAGP